MSSYVKYIPSHRYNMIHSIILEYSICLKKPAKFLLTKKIIEDFGEEKTLELDL